jgi:nitrate/nitrite-specific signal transduction histidine kinase
MLVPITALRAGARRLGAGDFGHRIDVKTSDELEELANQFNGMAGQLAETYSNLEAKVNERTRDLAQSINELKVLEEVGRAVASSLDLNAVLPTVAARALEITHADAVLIYGYDAIRHRFNLTESIGIDKSAEASHLAIEADGSPLGEAAAQGEPIALAGLDAAPDHPLRDGALAAGFQVLVVRWSISRACSVRWWCCARRQASSRRT